MDIDWSSLPPRLSQLMDDLNALNIDHYYRDRLKEMLHLSPNAILDRPETTDCNAWTDLEALQQLTLANAMESRMRRKFAKHAEPGFLKTGE